MDNIQILCNELLEEGMLAIHFNDFYPIFKNKWRDEFPHLRMPKKEKIANAVSSIFNIEIHKGYWVGIGLKLDDILVVGLDEE